MAEKVSRRIGIVTATRAEWGLIRPTVELLKKDPKAEVILFITGTHFSRKFGHTIDEIPISDKDRLVDTNVDQFPDTRVGVSLLMAHTQKSFTEALSGASLDLLVLVGDRSETLAVACAAAVLGIPIAHIGGGDETVGAIDNAMRHAITKLATWHLTASWGHSQRVLQMGESASRIFVTGAPGMDNLQNILTLPHTYKALGLNIQITRPIFLVTWHPETLGRSNVWELLKVLELYTKATIFVSGSNADAGGKEVSSILEEWAKSHHNVIYRSSFGQKLWNSLMAHCDVVLGNSSSGVIEAPALGVMSVDIGDRQKGRPKGATILNVGCSQQDITCAIQYSLACKDSDHFIPGKSVEYGYPGEVAPKIVDALLNTPIPETTQKEFHGY